MADDYKENREGEYWAKKPTNQIGKDLYARVDEYYADLETSGYFSVMRKSYRAYFGSSSYNYDHGTLFDSSEIRRTGEQGELHRIKVNHFRNLIQHVLVLTTNPRPAMEARATNSDYKSQTQTILADGILEYYMREKRLERYMTEAVEFALVFGGGYVSLQWDAHAGDPYGVDDDGEQVNTGDIRVQSHTPLDTIIDVYKETSEHDWIILRDYGNKYDYMTKHPDLAEALDRVPTKDSQVNRYTFATKTRSFPTSDIPIYTFFHKKTPSLPQGRMVVFASDEAVIYDGPLPYRDIPIYRITPSEFYGSPYGYTSAYDILALQEGIDSLYSAILTNNLTFATQNVWSPRGANVNITHLAGGLNLIESDGTMGPPQALNLTASSGETFKFLEMLEGAAETLAGINSVVRGNPESSLKSGSALALVASQAIQFNSGLQSSYIALLEDIGTGLIHMLQDYATVPRVAAIAGKAKRPYVKEFKGDDLSQINRVTVDVGSAVSRTTAGRVEMANNLLSNGQINNPEEYLAVIQTGKLDPMIEGQTAEILLIKAENEKLREGNMVQAIAPENHRLHISEHKAVLANPETKENPEIVQATLAHIEEHVELLRTTDPGLLMMTGQEPLPPEAPPPGQGPAPAPGGAPQGPEGAVAELPEVLRSGTAIEDELPDQPRMPTNPLTGEQYSNVEGGLE